MFSSICIYVGQQTFDCTKAFIVKSRRFLRPLLAVSRPVTRAVLALPLAALLCAAQDAGVDRGLAEFRQSRFAEAYQSWRGAADAGDARGSLYLGVLFDTGGTNLKPHKSEEAIWTSPRMASAPIRA